MDRIYFREYKPVHALHPCDTPPLDPTIIIFAVRVCAMTFTVPLSSSELGRTVLRIIYIVVLVLCVTTQCWFKHFSGNNQVQNQTHFGKNQVKFKQKSHVAFVIVSNTAYRKLCCKQRYLLIQVCRFVTYVFFYVLLLKQGSIVVCMAC